ncbi:hypothetical protein F52700_7683 [Fusarium sp. NRRL 52700]|nr:hypothetical protein F52700_7683 [Fusarium sp. NRRL 52700]
MGRELDPSWLWGWLQDSAFTRDDPVDPKYYIIAFTTIYVLYKTLKAMYTILVPTTVLLKNCFVCLAVLILSVVKLFILVLIPKLYENVLGRRLRPFFSPMWNVWEYLALPSTLTYLARIRFRAYQAVEMARKCLIYIVGEVYKQTGLKFQFPGLLDRDVTGIQPSDTGAERLVEESSTRRQAQDEQNRIAEEENRRMGIENEKMRLENEKMRLENEKMRLENEK